MKKILLSMGGGVVVGLAVGTAITQMGWLNGITDSALIYHMALAWGIVGLWMGVVLTAGEGHEDEEDIQPV